MRHRIYIYRADADSLQFLEVEIISCNNLFDNDIIIL